MGKFCTKCGKELTDGGVFCPGCGQQISGGIEHTKVSGNVRKLNVKKLGIIGVAMAVAVLGIILVYNVFSKGYEKPLRTYEKAINKQDPEQFREAFVPGYGDWTEMSDAELRGSLEQESEGVTCEMKVTKEEKMTPDDLTLYLEDEGSVYWDIVEKKGVEKCYLLNVDMIMSYNGDEESEELVLPVVKIDGTWYMAPL